ncbi:hypothetical protein LUZ61_004308 [Rhynchospora tenuis]|uniref:Trichome birefringence-like N-terminal domain-containing protein n=1 Tax=Rhynchospora tenuis TaxID=198213 RepID=A0AAD6ETF8_9POAL|nr:hypothetical protein LUZ61_004308 [Rhynchospora tenuis]
MASAVFLGYAPRFQNGTELFLLLRKKVTSFLLLSLGLSTIFLLLIWGTSSDSFIFTAKQALSHSAPPPGYPKIADLTSQITYDEAVLPSTNLIADNSTATVSSQFPNKNSSSIIDPCDMYTGKWVRETREPIYSNLTCPFIPENKKCQKHGKSPGYLYWRWKPDGCDLPWFEPDRFLNIVRGKTFAFVGDSLARNHFDSLVCLLSQAEVPINGDPNPFRKFLKVHFPSSNFTVMMIWTEFYVLGMPRSNALSTSFDIHLDKINTAWTSQLPGLDYLVISGGHWFYRKNYLYESDKLIGCIFCRGENLTEYSVPYVIRRVVRKALESIQSCQNCDKLITFLRSHTTSHFEKGSWSNGGYCNRTEPLNEREIDFDGQEWEIRRIQMEEIERIKGFDGVGDANRMKRYKWLDVTKAMMMRADGHPGKYYNKELFRFGNDCLHWCLPGPVDMWNEMLMLNLINTSSLD